MDDSTDTSGGNVDPSIPMDRIRSVTSSPGDPWAVALVWLLGLWVIMGLVGIIHSTAKAQHLRDVRQACNFELRRPCTEAEFEGLADAFEATSLRDHAVPYASGALLALTVPVWLLWQVRAHHRLMVEGTSRRMGVSPRMGAASWFIPGANLIVPFLAVRDLVAEGRSEGQGRLTVMIWWGTWLVGWLSLAIVPVGLLVNPNGMGFLMVRAWLGVAGFTALILSALSAIPIVRRIGAVSELRPSESDSRAEKGGELVEQAPRLFPSIPAIAMVATGMAAVAVVVVGLPELPASAFEPSSRDVVTHSALPNGWYRYEVANGLYAIDLPAEWVPLGPSGSEDIDLAFWGPSPTDGRYAKLATGCFGTGGFAFDVFVDDFEGRLEDDYSRVRMREAGLGTGRVVILEAHADAPIPHIVRQYVIQGGGTFCFAGFTVEGDDLSGFSPLLDRIVETLSSPA